VTGLVWLVLQTMSMTGLSFGDAMRSGTILTVVNETQFGLVSEVRAALALLLAACLVLNRFVLSRWLALVTALGLVGAIAWTGHAGSTLGGIGESAPHRRRAALAPPPLGSGACWAFQFCSRSVDAVRLLDRCN